MIWWISAGLSWGSSVLIFEELSKMTRRCKLAQGQSEKRRRKEGGGGSRGQCRRVSWISGGALSRKLWADRIS